MDYLAEHKRILELAESRQLPDSVNAGSAVSVAVFRELYEDGLLDAIRSSDMSDMNDGDAFIEPRITMRGRLRLAELRQRAAEASPAGKAKWMGGRLLAWVSKIAAIVIAAALLVYFGLDS
jgi:hypothetical protein